jgi:hypothetical protein
VPLTKLVASVTPPTWIVVVLKNPDPFTVKVSGPDPAVTVAGTIEVTVGKFAEGLLMVSCIPVEVPPPGVAFTAVSVRLPAVATSAAVSRTSTCVALTKVVVRPLPPTLITVVGTNPVPDTATRGGAVPATSVAGDNAVIVGAGFVTSRFTAVPDPLLAVPLSAITDSSAPLTSCCAVTVAVTCVALT